ncbi:hypothetical protein GIW81_00695 [Hyphomicrobium sp. xq]|uniref:SIR2-like domain-containing protein n=1 Tax=Hyphomicrobium album TaxID=2665159 RepID=A0A6I3KGB1_9HYPH|nr:hypothetical protein [Hyphomicrobium album]MTD92847.1 hypothetical protein [Hyphomicrobium album]
MVNKLAIRAEGHLAEIKRGLKALGEELRRREHYHSTSISRAALDPSRSSTSISASRSIRCKIPARSKMFESETVLIVGAGGSAPFGLPLARPLYEHIIAELNNFEKYIAKNRLPPTGANNASMFHDGAMVALASYLNSALSRDHLPQEMLECGPARQLLVLRDKLSAQTHDSLDQFIRDNPELAFVGKLMLARHIVLRMYEYRDGCYSLRSFANRAFLFGNDSQRNWYHQLINAIRDGAESAESLKRSRLQIITFNYDRTLECALDSRFANTSRHAGANWRDIIPVYHVHGGPDELPGGVHDVGRFLIDCASRIRLVGEDDEAGMAAVREGARKAVRDAKRVFMVGFHADPANLKTIGLPERQSKTGVFCLNFDGHWRVATTLLKLGVPNSNIWSGTAAEHLHIHTALDRGFLEQEPSVDPGTAAKERRARSGWAA